MRGPVTVETRVAFSGRCHRYIGQAYISLLELMGFMAMSTCANEPALKCYIIINLKQSEQR